MWNLTTHKFSQSLILNVVTFLVNNIERIPSFQSPYYRTYGIIYPWKEYLYDNVTEMMWKKYSILFFVDGIIIIY